MKNNTLTTLLLALATGVLLVIWLQPDNSSVHSDFEKELKERDAIIQRLQDTRRVLESQLDSLQSIRQQIEYRYDTLEIEHQNRHSLPFAVDDTAARYQFFANRFPDLFTGRSD
ncbi:MAG: hypothetical protein EP346_00215 [Bacteroidetes bacterium]|nr:MAG: hypothetical protein EP346_00215 [Bacteroidota bacterium]